MEEFTEEVKSKCDEIIKNFLASQKDKSIMAYQRFNEYMLRLENRFVQILIIEKEKDELEPGKMKRPLKDIQLDFVDKIEAYFQQVYSSLSALIMLLNHISPVSFKNQMPINSAEKFLTWISKQSYSSPMKDNIQLLDRAREFRSIYVDHPQQHILHDWMTYTHLNGTAIIYFIRDGNKVYTPEGVMDPYDPNFKPPIDHKSFYVSPDHKKVHEAMKSFTSSVLKLTEEKSHIT